MRCRAKTHRKREKERERERNLYSSTFEWKVAEKRAGFRKSKKKTK